MNGITLVALVVTIVVLLILAGITIVTLFGESGIINKAQKAKNLTEAGVANDLAGLEKLTGLIQDELAPKVAKGEMVGKETKYAKYADNTSSDVVPIPGGYCVVKDSKTGEKNTIESGLVISDLAKDTLDNDEIGENRGNQFVWVPVSEEELSEMYGTDKDGKKWGKLYKFTTTGKTNNNWTETDGIMSITKTNYNCEPEIITDSDGADATDDSSYFKEAISSTMTGVEFKAQLEREFNEMIKSVQKYGGFYIGRYETSGISNTDKTVVPTVQKGGTVGNFNWYYQYQETKNIANANNNVTSSMIWGCQWDRTLEWIAQTNKKADGQPDWSLLTDSRSWGNYKDSTGEAATNSGEKNPQPSGTNPAWQKNHIYDLAGNANDYTMEKSENPYRPLGTRVNRGFQCYNQVSGFYSFASYRSNVGSPGEPGGGNGKNCSRATLYIQ